MRYRSVEQAWQLAAADAAADGRLETWAADLEHRTGLPVPTDEFARWVGEAPVARELRWGLVDVLADASAAGDTAAATGLAVVLARVVPPSTVNDEHWDDLTDALALVLAGRYRGNDYRGLLAPGRERRRREQRRSRHAGWAVPTDLHTISAPTPRASDDDRLVDQLDARTAVRALMGAVSRRYRAAIWQRLAHDEPTDDVAAEHGLSPRTLRRRLHELRQNPPDRARRSWEHAA